MLKFPAGKHDDSVDVCSLMGRGLEFVAKPRRRALVETEKEKAWRQYGVPGFGWDETAQVAVLLGSSARHRLAVRCDRGGQDPETGQGATVSEVDTRIPEYLEVHGQFFRALAGTAAGAFESLKNAYLYDRLELKKPHSSLWQGLASATHEHDSQGALAGYVAAIGALNDRYKPLAFCDDDLPLRPWDDPVAFLRGLWLSRCRFADLKINAVNVDFLLATDIEVQGIAALTELKLLGGLHAVRGYFRDGLTLANCDVSSLSLRKFRGLKLLRIDSCKLHTLDVHRSQDSGRTEMVVLDGSTEIAGGAYFDGLTVSDSFVVRAAAFKGSALFRGTKFNRVLELGGDFHRFPELFGAELSEETHFRELRLGGQALGYGNPARLESDGARASELNAVRCLRVLAQQRKWKSDEGKLFAEEQRLERSLLKGRSNVVERLLSTAYDCVSAYGCSVARPLMYFLGWNVVAALLYWPVLDTTQLSIGGQIVDLPMVSLSTQEYSFKGWEPVVFALQNAVNPFALFSTKPLVAATSFPALLLGVVQALGSLAIFALWLLAIRGRFQRTGAGGNG